MGRGASGSSESAAGRRVVLPAQLKAVLPADTHQAWVKLAPVLPGELYLGGGTGVAVHLHHRESRDLDFFYHRGAVDLGEVERAISEAGKFAVSLRQSGTLRGVFGSTKVEFFNADEAAPQTLLNEPAVVAGLRVAGLPDLMAMKLKVVRERGELRDYFDIKQIDQEGGLSVEDGLAYFMQRYNINAQDPRIAQVVKALGYLDDLEEDDLLPISKTDLSAWWAKRQAALVRHLARNPLP